MQQLILAMLSGLGLSLLLGWYLRFEQKSIDAKRLADAEQVLSKNGLSSYYYLAACGSEDGPLRDALTIVEHSGKIVLNKQGHLVGRILPKVAKSAHLRLVVNNTKSQGSKPC